MANGDITKYDKILIYNQEIAFTSSRVREFIPITSRKLFIRF